MPSSNGVPFRVRGVASLLVFTSSTEIPTLRSSVSAAAPAIASSLPSAIWTGVASAYVRDSSIIRQVVSFQSLQIGHSIVVTACQERGMTRILDVNDDPMIVEGL